MPNELFDNMTGAAINSPFKLQRATPLDPRTVVTSYSDLNLIVEGNAVYDGMLVWVTEDKKAYRYISGEWVEDNNVFEDIVTNTTVGGIASGTNLSNQSVKDVLADMLSPIQVDVKLYGSNNQEILKDIAYEKGTLVNLRKIKLNIDSGSNKIIKISVYYNGIDLIDSINGTNLYGEQILENIDLDIGPDTELTIKLQTDSNKIITLDSIVLNFVYPYYYGSINQNDTISSVIDGLTKVVDKQVNQTLTFTSQNQNILFLSPYELSGIEDENEFDALSSFIHSTVDIQCAYESTHTYHAYRHINLTNGTFTFTFQFSEDDEDNNYHPGQTVDTKNVKVYSAVIGTSQNGWTEDDCDYLCDGTNDAEIIQQVIDLYKINDYDDPNERLKFPASILLLAGNYYINDVLDINNVLLEGQNVPSALNSKTILYLNNNTKLTHNIYNAVIKGIRIDNIIQHGASGYNENNNHEFNLHSVTIENCRILGLLTGTNIGNTNILNSTIDDTIDVSDGNLNIINSHVNEVPIEIDDVYLSINDSLVYTLSSGSGDNALLIKDSDIFSMSIGNCYKLSITNSTFEEDIGINKRYKRGSGDIQSININNCKLKSFEIGSIEGDAPVIINNCELQSLNMGFIDKLMGEIYIKNCKFTSYAFIKGNSQNVLNVYFLNNIFNKTLSDTNLDKGLISTMNKVKNIYIQNNIFNIYGNIPANATDAMYAYYITGYVTESAVITDNSLKREDPFSGTYTFGRIDDSYVQDVIRNNNIILNGMEIGVDKIGPIINGLTLDSDINMQFNQIYNLQPPTADSDAATKSYVDTQISNSVDIEFGVYTGNGNAERTITLGFTPAVVELWTEYGYQADTDNYGRIYGGMAFQNYPLKSDYQSGQTNYPALEIVTNGFKVREYSGSIISNEPHTNSNTVKYYFKAYKSASVTIY